MNRLDVWLWSARFFKTRVLAAAAVDGGRVELNGQRTKRGKPVRPGDALRIRIGPHEYRVLVLAEARRRGPPEEAASWYREEPESRAARERLSEQHRAAASASLRAKGRPTKRDRRALEKLKQREP
ncbi:MAG TPA: RNA-binding S4 domain-containing protein [Gemmatimonadales bacterium]|nr:RNA-binding S4 domain-containing protein [Gemmatimonadales bacterium]